MIIGLGTDIVEVGRIASAYAKFGESFLNRVLLPNEIAYCLAHKDPTPYLAARFAAKEAMAKAFGTGIGAELGWHDMEIVREASGAPVVLLHGLGLKLFQARKAGTMLISMSHTENYATATAILCA